MGILLFEHNCAAYDAAVSMLKEYNKAAVIHPTGTGKSFIAFKLCEDNPNKTVCWLSPSEYIYKTQLENLKAVSGYTPHNVTFLTYAKLMNMSDREIKGIQPDYIILDEFHRCGAEMWGRGVKELLTIYSQIPILGLSATAIRYLDNQRNMADELFEGKIASEMTLGEAIVRGILNPPKYVISTFSFQKDLNKYKNRVKRAKNKAVRAEGEKYLDALKKALDKADGLDEIFYKHMNERTGKYIIFCSDYEHMCQMRELAGEWFNKVDKTPRIYSLYSEDPSSDEEFQKFKADSDNTHLRLLYCIDALNEGVHVDDVSGVILLRPTVSPIIYKQQIGRALQTGIKQSSVIFDIVLNIENLYSIGTIEEEMRLAVSYYRSRGLESDIVNEHFRVIDEVKDCLSLFDKLNETLTASWEYMYSEAKKYYEENGDLEIPKRYKTENGYSLGNWLMTQKRVYNGTVNGILTEERIEKLNKIGMVWESKKDASWQRYFSAAQEYSKAYGNLDVPALYVTKNGVKLGKWITNLRTARKNGYDSKYLTEERTKALDEIGMIWKVADYMWQQYYGACLTYYGINGNLDIPYSYVTGDGLKLGIWINNIRTARKKRDSKLTKEQIAALDAIGMVWSRKYEHAWNRAYDAAQLYFETYGHLNVPVTYITADGLLLGKWIDRQRRNTQISDVRKAKLNKIGMIWKKQDTWDIRFELAKAYFEKNGNLEISTNYVVDGIWLGKWLAEQRTSKAKGALSKDKIERLDKIGMDWLTPAARTWETYFLACERYYKHYGNIDISTTYTDENGLHLGRWLKKQCKNKAKLKSDNENGDRIKRLENIGMVWDRAGM